MSREALLKGTPLREYLLQKGFKSLKENEYTRDGIALDDAVALVDELGLNPLETPTSGPRINHVLQSFTLGMYSSATSADKIDIGELPGKTSVSLLIVFPSSNAQSEPVAPAPALPPLKQRLSALGFIEQDDGSYYKSGSQLGEFQRLAKEYNYAFCRFEKGTGGARDYVYRHGDSAMILEIPSSAPASTDPSIPASIDVMFGLETVAPTVNK